MDCKWVHSKLIDYAENSLPKEDKSIIKKHLDNCSLCSKELQQIETTIADFNSMPYKLPSVEFKEKLKLKIEDEIKSGRSNKVFWFKPLRKYAASIIMLLCGGLLGYLFTTNHNLNKELGSLKTEINNIKVQESLAVIEEKTASQKIQAISALTLNNSINNEIYNALVNCLVSDENPNVRLTAAKALVNYKEIDNVKFLLIESLEYQTDPIVQVFMINTISNFENKDAIRAIQSLMNSDNVNAEIREYSKTVLQNSSIKL